MTDWTTTAGIKAQARQDWDRGRILAARVDGGSLYPRAARFKRPDSRAIGDQFAEVQQWIEALVAGSRSARGRGYEIEWEEIAHRQIGRNRIPCRVVIPSDVDAAYLAGRLRELEAWDKLAVHTLARFPAVKPWLRRRPQAVVEHADVWGAMLAVVTWFDANPRSGLYLRELDIPGVDTKFIEQHRGLLTELLDSVLASEAVRSDARTFEERYGIRTKPLRIRFRSLDPSITVGGHADVETDVESFARSPMPVHRVVVVENEINFLTFPAMESAIVIWGGGYGVDRLARVSWLASRRVIYWGDIDTHGFGILSRLRAIHPRVDSILMDRTTLTGHPSMWTTEEKPRVDDLPNLTADEHALYDDLRFGVLGDRVRLEQERLRYTVVREAVAALAVPSSP